jgi:hypothetical protein
MTTRNHQIEESHESSQAVRTHVVRDEAFLEVMGLMEVLEEQYQEGDELDTILVENIIDGVIGALTLYATFRLCRTESEERDDRLRYLMRAAVTAIVGPPPVA